MSSPQDFESFLKQLFQNYATDRTKGTVTNMKLLRFKQLLADADLTSRIELKKLELVFLSESKHKGALDFEAFLNCLPRLAAEVWPDLCAEDLRRGLETLVTTHLFPLFQRLQTEVEEQSQLDFDEDTPSALGGFVPSLQEMYLAYFQWELSPSSQLSLIKQKSHDALQELLRDFDVCPLLINKAAQFAIWRETMEQSAPVAKLFTELLPRDIGKVFLLSHLLQVVYKCSQVAYRDEPAGPTQKFAMLVERMELSHGFISLKKRVSGLRTLKPPKSMTRAATAGALEIALGSSMRSMRSVSLQQTVVEADPMFLEVADKSMPMLQSIFQYYCELGEPTNTSRLQSTKFVRLLRDAGIVKTTNGPADFDAIDQRRREGQVTMTKVEADILFSKLTGGPKVQRSGPSALDFPLFLKALETLALRLEPNGDTRESYVNFFKEYFSRFGSAETESEMHYASKLLELLRQPEMPECVECLQRSLGYFFQKYADKAKMRLPHFLRFSRDFGVFPDVCGKGKLVQIFTSLAKAQTASGQLSASRIETEGELCLEERVCMEALVVVSSEIEYAAPQPSPIEKVCLLLERMNQSQGPVKALREFGQRNVTSEVQDLLVPMKQRFPEFFMKQLPGRVSFRSLLSGMGR